MTSKPTDNPRSWLCPAGHLLGHVESDRSGLKLILYEQAIDPRWPKHDTSPVYRGTLRGEAIVRCTVCQADKEWHPDQEALDRLIRRTKAARKKIKSEVAAIGLTFLMRENNILT